MNPQIVGQHPPEGQGAGLLSQPRFPAGTSPPEGGAAGRALNREYPEWRPCPETPRPPPALDAPSGWTPRGHHGGEWGWHSAHRVCCWQFVFFTPKGFNKISKGYIFFTVLGLICLKEKRGIFLCACEFRRCFNSFAWLPPPPKNECHFLIHLDYFRKPNAHYRIRAGAGNRREALNLGTSP